MYRYAQIIPGNGAVVGDSHLSGPVNHPNMIPIPENFDLTNKRYVNGEWQVHIPPEPEPVEPEPTEQDLINAEILLKQAKIISTQNETNDTLKQILANQQTKE